MTEPDQATKPVVRVVCSSRTGRTAERWSAGPLVEQMLLSRHNKLRKGMTERAFENNFSDYDGSSDVFLPDGEFTNKLEQERRVLELAGVLEKDLVKRTNRNDLSVYTGTKGVD
ncbi:uncharacterized protein LOC121045611 [Ixodes scapularis]|uniref:uncharacterized protein LOC121045611 n=1 Tax=Ixodes scapularis TaxID=6945 RepID=UPI001AD6EFDF|nr:uncharacterized protein LOC121045611 [Ixodes scapularis]